MAEVFQYLDPNDYSERERLDSLYQSFVSQGSPDGYVIAIGMIQESPESPIVAATALYATMIEKYIGGTGSWNSDASPSITSNRKFTPYQSWGVVDIENIANYYHDRGFVYLGYHSYTDVFFPALYQVRAIGASLQPSIKAHTAAEIVHVYHEIHMEISGQSLSDLQSVEFFQSRLSTRLTQRFDKAKYYVIADGIATANGVSYQINLSDYLRLPLVNKVNVIA